MEPAASIIDSLGGVTEVAKIVGVHRTRVSNWKRARDVGGTGGVIPVRHAAKLIEAAQDRGVDLDLASFFPAPEVAE